MTAYEYLNLIASYGSLALLFYGIRVMAKVADIRAADSERKHVEAMTESERKHDEVMAESRRRHNEFMVDSRRREEEGIRRQEESMAALRELIDGQADSRLALRELIERTR
ncbi:MAG: hypothetical protein OXL41_04865 [Nitrospinae bacterium]|nr:hypothetical protein [Nitrospinota bacterium]